MTATTTTDQTPASFMQQQMDDQCREADADAPASLTELVRAVAKQDAATPEQVAELMTELSWAFDKGDRLDSQLAEVVERSFRMTTEWLPDEKRQHDWCQDHPDELDFPLADAVEEFKSTVASELDCRQNVAAWCASLVNAGEHGTDSRRRAVDHDWFQDWKSVVD